MKLRQHIPNLFTCGNLFCGCLAIVQAFEGDLIWAAYLVGIAVVLDFFDGFAARMLKVSSPIGKDLDSLADMVTFGVVPSIMIFQMMKNVMAFYSDEPSLETIYAPYIAFIIPIFSAIRLARFNNDTRQTTSFIGLPTPANAVFFCSLPFFQIPSLQSGNVLALLCIIFSFLLIAPLPMFSLKVKNFAFKGNEIRYMFLALSLVLLITLKFVGIPLVIILYILMSLVNNFLIKNKAGQ